MTQCIEIKFLEELNEKFEVDEDNRKMADALRAFYGRIRRFVDLPLTLVKPLPLVEQALEMELKP